MERQAIDLYIEMMNEFKIRLAFVGSMCERMYIAKGHANIVDIENICL